MEELAVGPSTNQSQVERDKLVPVPYNEGALGTSRRYRMLILINLAGVIAVASLTFAILAPFYPEEAMKKGVSTALVGVIFAEFELVMFITTPMMGYLLPRIGAKFTYVSGVFIVGTATALFGLLAYCPSGVPFIATSLLVRGVMALGCSMLVTSSFAIVATVFPDNVSSMFGLMETFSGIGLMIGPPVGGALYQLGGFVTPFAVVGGLILLSVPVTMVALKFDPGDQPSENRSLLSILVNPHILISCLVLWGCAATIGFMDPSLQPFLQSSFNLNHFLVGLVFFCNPFTYAVLAPAFGYICDKKPLAKPMMAFSLLLTGLGWLLINPSPLLDLGPPRLWLTILVLFLFGIGGAAAFAPSSKDILTESLIMGLPENFGTVSLVSGFINSSLALGYFSGPLLSGFLTEKYGYAWSTTVMGLIVLGFGGVYLVYIIVFMICCGGRHRVVPREVAEVEERQPLLSTVR